MRYPEFLKSGGSIGYVAPSFGCAGGYYKLNLDRTLEIFQQLGYKNVLGPNCYEESGVGISNTPEKCGEELENMYVSPDNDILISCGGGELMCEILNYVDFDRIKAAKEKWFVGYSDNTNFTFLQTTINDVAAIYAPCAGAFAMNPWHKSIEDLYSLITGKCENGTFSFAGYDGWEKESLKSEENPTAPLNITEKSVIKTFNGLQKTTDNVEFSGRMIGGCMDCLVNLLGTRFDKVEEFVWKYKDDGIVWFLESCDLNVFAIRRAMWQMENAGWFKYVKGFIIGRPLVFGQEMMGLDQYDAVLGIIGKYNVPVVMDVDLGHCSPAMPYICGSYGKVLAENGSYNVDFYLK